MCISLCGTHIKRTWLCTISSIANWGSHGSGRAVLCESRRGHVSIYYCLPLNLQFLTTPFSADTLFMCYCIDRDIGNIHKEEVFDAVCFLLLVACEAYIELDLAARMAPSRSWSIPLPKRNERSKTGSGAASWASSFPVTVFNHIKRRRDTFTTIREVLISSNCSFWGTSSPEETRRKPRKRRVDDTGPWFCVTRLASLACIRYALLLRRLHGCRRFLLFAPCVLGDSLYHITQLHCSCVIF